MRRRWHKWFGCPSINFRIRPNEEISMTCKCGIIWVWRLEAGSLTLYEVQP